jgi:hypothetical protein
MKLRTMHSPGFGSFRGTQSKSQTQTIAREFHYIFPMAHLDVSQWLVTPLNPPTSTSNGLDYTRCAELHNYIAQVGWGGSGRSLDDFPQATWFEKYGEAAENVRDRLDPSLAKFLELSYHGDHTQTAFYYWVTGFDQPEGLWFADDDFDSRYLTLYAQNAGIGTKADGLKYGYSSTKWQAC